MSYMRIDLTRRGIMSRRNSGSPICNRMPTSDVQRQLPLTNGPRRLILETGI